MFVQELVVITLFCYLLVRCHGSLGDHYIVWILMNLRLCLKNDDDDEDEDFNEDDVSCLSLRSFRWNITHATNVWKSAKFSPCFPAHFLLDYCPAYFRLWIPTVALSRIINNSLTTLGSLLNKEWNKWSVEEKFKEVFVIFFKWWCRNSGPEFTFWCEKNIFNQDHRSSAVQRATVNNSGGKETQHASHRNFWNLSTKVGGVARRKLGPIPHIGGVRSRTCTEIFVKLFLLEIFHITPTRATMVQESTKYVKYTVCFPMGSFSFICGMHE